MFFTTRLASVIASAAAVASGDGVQVRIGLPDLDGRPVTAVLALDRTEARAFARNGTARAASGSPGAVFHFWAGAAMHEDADRNDPDLDLVNQYDDLYDADGKIQFDKDREAANQYFLQHVNQNTVFFHDLDEKLDYLVEENYYEPEVLEKYDFEFVKKLSKLAYGHKFRFKTFLGAFKYYTSYTLKTFDGRRYLERFEDRVSMTALFLADGNGTFIDANRRSAGHDTCNLINPWYESALSNRIALPFHVNQAGAVAFAAMINGAIRR